MQRFRQLGLTLIVVFALGAIASATASAEEGGFPSILPTPTALNPARFTSTSGVGFLVGGAVIIECKKDTNHGEFTSARLGIITIDFKECKLGANNCKTAGDAAEEVLLDKAGIHLVDLIVGGVLRLGIEVTIPNPPLVVTCGVVTVNVRGLVIGLALNITSLVKTKTLTLKFEEEKGKQAIKECELDKEFCFEENAKKEKVHKKFLLEIETGKEKSVEAGLGTTDEITFEKEIEVHF